MLADDKLTYSYQKAAPNKLAERALITLERTQKLDLLIHLLTNLQQSLVVCGPHGIGKTTLLQALQNARADHWHFCQLSGSSSLSFESILQQLGRSLNLGDANNIQPNINALRSRCQQQQVVLIIDDAGNLVPGLIGELSSFADSVNGLRLVFAMSHDEFHIMSISDTILEECHVIELPPLNRKQCLDYLQNLSAHPDMPLSFNGINDTLVEDLYRETHGIPGRILAELPKLNHYRSRHYKKWLIWLAAISATAAAGFAGHLWYSQPNQDPTTFAPATEFAVPTPTATTAPIVTPTITSLPTPAAVVAESSPLAVVPNSDPAGSISATPLPITFAKPTPATTATAPPTTAPATSHPAVATSAPSLVQQTTAVTTPSPIASILPTPVIAATSQPLPPATPVPTAAPIAKETVVSATAVPATKTATAENANVPTSDQDWIIAQPASNFTLQVMTLSSKDSVRRFMKKYAEYGESLKYYTVHKGEQEKFILIYGSFESIAEAKRYKEIMPGEFKQALEKRFRIIQKESNR